MTSNVDDLSASTLRKELLRVFTVSRAEEVSASLLSVVTRLQYAQLQLKDVELHAKTASSTGLIVNGEMETTADSTADEDECHRKYYRSMFYFRKHVIECVQHMHAIGDTTAYALYHLVDLTQQLRPDSVYSHTLLQPKFSKQLGAFDLYLRELIVNEHFAYLSDFNNQAKHKGLALPKLALCVEENDPVSRLFFGPITMKFEKSQREGVRYEHPNTPIFQFLTDEIRRICEIHNRLTQKVQTYLQGLPSRVRPQQQASE